MQRWYFMKKFSFVFLVSFFLFLPFCSAKEKEMVTLSKCVDGDTAKFELDGEVITARFLAIDTPETKHPKKGEEPFGKEASNFTCESLKQAQKIELEYDPGSDKTDKYKRHLVWVFVDGELLQDNIIKKGYAEVAYLYGDYKYTSLLQDHEAIAKKEKLGIWGDIKEEQTNYWYGGLFLVGGVFIYLIGSKKTKKKVQNKIKKQLKKEIQNHF